MKALEIAPLEDKKLVVLLVEKEYNEPFWMIEPPSTPHSRMLRSLFRPSIAFHKFLGNLAKKVNPDFATEELGMRSQKEFYEDNVLAQLFRKDNIPFFPVDIDGNAKMYVATNLDKKRDLRDNVLKALARLSKKKSEKDSLEKEYLVAYGQCLQLELDEQEREVSFPIRESWIVMGILDHAREFDAKEEITCIHVCSPEHVDGVKKLLESVDVRVEVLKLSKKIVSAHVETPRHDELANLLESMQILVKPVVRKTSEDAPHLLFYLDTDEKASPFDICMAYDAGYNAVIPYENVTPEDAKKIVQDAIFSRGPKAVKHTCFFIGGKSAEKAVEVFEVVRDTMFPPFKATIIVDPGGAYTTAAAMVAKVEDALLSHKLGDLKDKTCAVLGTGAVGRIAAVLLAKLGCNVMVASLNPKRVDGREYAENLARLLASRYGVKVQGVFAPTGTEKLEILKKADVVFCAGIRGVRVIEKELLKELKLVKVLVDINAIPPFGVEGIKLKDDMREIAPGIFGIGALKIGDLKHKLEKEILREVRSNGKEIYNYNLALQLARKLLQKEVSPAKLALTLSYPPAKRDSK
ncbi:MAG: NAD(P)-dependent methylenetetrahydromethanopterin dehydrogenase [Candidatus Bathyarchaeia archaeon]